MVGRLDASAAARPSGDADPTDEKRQDDDDHAQYPALDGRLVVLVVQQEVIFGSVGSVAPA